jgi:hypothetical protein
MELSKGGGNAMAVTTDTVRLNRLRAEFELEKAVRRRLETQLAGNKSAIRRLQAMVAQQRAEEAQAMADDGPSLSG